MCDSQQPLRVRPLLLVAVIGTFHILAGSWDQFVSNVLLGNGRWYQQSRDMAFVSFDLLHVLVSGVYLLRLARQASTARPGPTKKDIVIAGGTVIILTIITTLL